MTRRMFLRFFAGACLACGGLGGGGYAFLRKNMFGACRQAVWKNAYAFPALLQWGIS